MKIRKKGIIASLVLLFISASVSAQEVQMSQTASLGQVYGDIQESQGLLPMADLGMESGYVLYETEVATDGGQTVLQVENVRDYAAVYIDKKMVGRLTDEKKILSFEVESGEHLLQLYVENIGRITYGPEILDNSKGLFGSVTLNDREVENWKMTPLLVKECEVDKLNFEEQQHNAAPCFYKGTITMGAPRDIHLDISGWGMGEVWVNGHYAGSYWEESSQQSIPVSASSLVEGKNSIVLFELKNNGKSSVCFTEKPIFK